MCHKSASDGGAQGWKKLLQNVKVVVANSAKLSIEIIRNRNDRFFTLGGPARVMSDFAKTYVEVQEGKNSIATYLLTYL
jgi:hypothetical protein